MKIIKDTDEELEILFEDETPTMFIILKNELDKIPEVLISAWRREHPMFYKIYFYVRTNGKKTPREVIKEAIENSIKKLDRIEKEFKSNLK